MKVWHVYVDYTNSRIPFYVGKGNIKRVNCKKHQYRSEKHKTICEIHGLNREIVFTTQDEGEAISTETRLIDELHTFIDDPLAPNIACNRKLRGVLCKETLNKLSKAGQHDCGRKAKISEKSRAAHKRHKDEWNAMQNLIETLKEENERLKKLLNLVEPHSTKKSISESFDSSNLPFQEGC